MQTKNLIKLILQVKKETEKDLQNAKLLFIEGIEDTMPDFRKPLDKVNYKEYFKDKVSEEFGEIYSEIIDLYMDLNQDNLNYTFGEKIDFSKEDFFKRMADLENKLQKSK